MSMNQLHTTKNSFQGDYKKVLCLCSAGILRSPTAAVVLAQEPFNFNTRAAGVSTYHAMIPVSDVLLTWADEIVVMEEWMKKDVELVMENVLGCTAKSVVVLNIEDNYCYRDPQLMKLIRERYEAQTQWNRGYLADLQV